MTVRIVGQDEDEPLPVRPEHLVIPFPGGVLEMEADKPCVIDVEPLALDAGPSIESSSQRSLRSSEAPPVTSKRWSGWWKVFGRRNRVRGPGSRPK